MALILAIEPDRRQASHLTAMVRGKLHAEIVLGDSAEHALAALGDRIPDLILTSALLSPKDESALDERLRALNGVAAHVQTLTIPVLAAPSRARDAIRGGVLSALRRDKGKVVVSEGCDPAVFAEQCREYLQHAAAERDALAERNHDASFAIEMQPPAAPVDRTIEPEAAAALDLPMAAAPDTMPEALAEFAVEPDAAMAAAPEPIEPLFVEPAPVEPAPIEAAFEPAIVEPAFVEPPIVEPIVAAPEPAPTRKKKRSADARKFKLSETPESLMAVVAALEANEAEAIAAAAPIEPIVEEPIVQAPIVQEAVFEEPVVEEPIAHHTAPPPREIVDLDLSSLLDEVSIPDAKPSAAPREEEPFVYELDGSLDLSSLDAFQIEEPAPAKHAAPVAPPPAPVTPPPAPAPQPAAAEHAETADWLDIIEALRRDAERVKFAPLPAAEEPTLTIPAAIAPTPVPPPIPSTPPVAVAPPPPDPAQAGKKKRKRTKGAPVQDEWGFFDPEQCGFAALIEKLEEIIDKDDAPTPRRA